MGRPITNAIRAAAHLVDTDQAWLWLAEISSKTPGKYFRLTSVSKAVTVASKVFQSGLVRVEVPGEELEGELGDAKLVVPAVGGVAMAYVESEGDLIGQSVTLTLAHESDLSTLATGVAWSMTILDAEYRAPLLSAACGHRAVFQRIPGPVFDRVRFPQLVRGRWRSG